MSSSSDGVSTHVSEEEPLTYFHERHHNVLAHSINGVTSGAEHCGRHDDTLVQVREEHSARKRVLVVKVDAVESTVDTIVDVIETAGHLTALLDNTAAHNVSDESVTSSSKVPARLADEASSSGELSQDREKISSNVVDGRSRIVLSKEATTDVEEVHLEAVTLSHLEDFEGIRSSDSVTLWITTAAADVIADTDDLDLVLSGGLEDAGNVLHESAKLAAEAALRARIVSCDTKHEFGLREDLSDLDDLVLIIEGHTCDADLASVGDLNGHLARVSKDDATGRDAEAHDAVDLVGACAVEASTQGAERLEEDWGGVALDGVVGHDAGEAGFEGEEAGDDGLEVEEVEGLLGVLGAGGAACSDGLFDALLQRDGVVCVDFNVW